MYVCVISRVSHDDDDDDNDDDDGDDDDDDDDDNSCCFEKCSICGTFLSDTSTSRMMTSLHP